MSKKKEEQKKENVTTDPLARCPESLDSYSLASLSRYFCGSRQASPRYEGVRDSTRIPRFIKTEKGASLPTKKETDSDSKQA